MNLLYLTISVIVLAILYNNVESFNQFNILFIRLGSVLLLGSVYFAGKYIYYITKQSSAIYHNLKHGYKTVVLILLILLLVLAYSNQKEVVNSITKSIDKITFSKFNPIELSEGKIVTKSQGFLDKLVNTFSGFLPAPWGTVVVWVVIFAIVLSLLSKFVFHGDLPSWITWLIIFIGIIMLFQYKMPYATVPVTFNAHCNGNQFSLDTNILGLGQMGVALQCADYKSSQCRTLCVNEKPYCQCEANLWDQLFHQKGDWIYSIFGG